ncbi:MAG: hypothetical protein ACLF0P_02500 [Thermoanaerobaculia bacterium]
MKRLLLVPYTFVLMNWAAVRGLWCYLRRSDAARVWSAPSAAGGRAGAPDGTLHRAESP